MSFRRIANLLVLSAMLALSSVPTLGRWWVSSTGAARLDVHAAHAGTHLRAGEPAQTPWTAAADCHYCPILAGTVLPDLPGVFPASHATHGDPASTRAGDARATAPAGGLGARGPPRRG